MPTCIVTDFQLSIKEGQLEEFKAFVNTMIEVTDVNEPNTLGYEWYINEDGSECHLLETFKNSEECYISKISRLCQIVEAVCTAR